MRLRASSNQPRHYENRKRAAQLVKRRWERNGHCCESCDMKADVVEVAHLFGRGHILAEPWASDPLLCAALCCARTWKEHIGCHERIDRNIDTDLRDGLRSTAIFNFCQEHKLTLPEHYISDPLGSIREIAKELEGRSQ